MTRFLIVALAALLGLSARTHAQIVTPQDGTPILAAPGRIALVSGKAAASVPSWVQPGALIDIDFVADRSYRSGSGSGSSTAPLTMSRASGGCAFDATPTLQCFGTNAPRRTNAGLADEAASTNTILNSTMAGVTSGGTATPTGWYIAWGGFSTAVTPVTLAGMNCMALTLSGTAASGNYLTWQENADSQAVAAANGQSWTYSIFGSVTGQVPATFRLGVLASNSSGGVVQTAFAAKTLTATLTDYADTMTMSDATTAYVYTNLYAYFAAGTALGGTVIDICNPQLEQQAAASTPIATAGTMVTRAADVISIPASGVGRIVTTYADGSSATVSGLAAASYTLPNSTKIVTRITGYAS